MNEPQHEWIYDWNRIKKVAPISQKPFELLDETLRDGIQSPSATDPTTEQKIELVHLMENIGIAAVDMGLPGAGKRAFDDVLAIATEIRDSKMNIRANCAARTKIEDILPIVELQQKVGIPITVYAFIGSSPIRLFAESWHVDTLMEHMQGAIRFAIAEGMQTCLVTEDTTRSRPSVLDPLFRGAIELGVQRLCLCDTVGHATPDGIHNLFEWVLSLIRGLGADVKLDWHGHNDRGLGVTNALRAIEAGADCIHGTGLGIGERVGNASIDQILLNLKLLDEFDHDLSHLLAYCQAVARACHVDIPYNYPLAGIDAFRTGTGVHAAAIIKAQKKSDAYMADRVYSGVPAGMFGRHQEIEVSHMSGLSNVIYWLESRRIAQDPALVDTIFSKAKSFNRVLTEDEILQLVRTHEQGQG